LGIRSKRSSATAAMGMGFAVAAAVVLYATVASATTYFVDGACATSGTGTSITCGASGPFRTIGAGVQAMVAGDTLNIRGAHGTFDGVYFEQITLEDGTGLPGKALRCTASQRCVIQGCRAPACPANEVPIVRGMTRRTDWVSRAGGVYSRAMEATPQVDGQGRSEFGPDYDPYMLMEDDGSFPMTMLAYAGDNVTAPGDGQWSFITASHQVYVNPIGSANPSTAVYVPHYAFNVHLEDPTAYLTIQYLTTEGTRGRGMEVRGVGSADVNGLVIRGVTQRYVPRHFILGQNLPGLLLEDNVAEYGCRGWSFANPQSDGCFGYRLFAVPGGILRRNTMRHLGSAGRMRFSGPNGWPCSWCDPPWNDPNHSQVSSFGVGYQVKQTEGATIEDNVADDLEEVGISLDVARRVTVQRNVVTRVTRGIGMRNFTPTAGCPSTSPLAFCYNSDHTIAFNTIDNVGFGGDASQCGIMIEVGGARHTGATMLARVVNNVVTNSPTAGICVINDDDTLPIPDLTVAHNTVVGTPRGLIVRDAMLRMQVQSNLFTSVSEDAILLSTAAMAGTMLDGDSVGPGAACPVRWRVPGFGSLSIPDTGGTCSTLAAFAAASPPNEASGPDPTAGAGGVTSTTTTLTPPSTTTSTTLVTQGQLSGRKLLLKDGGTKRFTIVSADQDQLTLGDADTVASLIAQGGSLRITAVGGDAFSQTYPLPPANWQLLLQQQPGRGVFYRARGGPVSKVRFVAGKKLLLVGKSPDLQQTLGSEPSQIQVELRIGARRYCLVFGGDRKQFIPDARLILTNAPRPTACP